MSEINSLPTILAKASGYYRFEDNINDSVGSNNGTPTSIDYVTGKYGKAADYSADTDRINFSDDVAFAFGTGDFTIAFWANLDSIPSPHCFFYYGNGGQPHFYFRHLTNNVLNFATFDGSSGTNLSSSNNFVETGLHHYVFRRSSTELAVFRDGGNKESTTGTVRNITNSTSPELVMGNWHSDAPDRGIDGWLDDWGFFKGEALSDAEILLLFADEVINPLKYYRKVRFPGPITGVFV